MVIGRHWFNSMVLPSSENVGKVFYLMVDAFDRVFHDHEKQISQQIEWDTVRMTTRLIQECAERIFSNGETVHDVFEYPLEFEWKRPLFSFSLRFRADFSHENSFHVAYAFEVVNYEDAVFCSPVELRSFLDGLTSCNRRFESEVSHFSGSCYPSVADWGRFSNRGEIDLDEFGPILKTNSR